MGAIQAQEKQKSIYFNFGSGMHSLKYDLLDGVQNDGKGYTLNLGYNYMFSSSWGIGTGLGIETFKSDGIVNYQTRQSSTDTDGESFEFRTQYSNWKEKQNALLLNIPVGLVYQRQIKEKWKIQFLAGPKLSFALNAEYETDGGSIETTGFYPQYNVVLSGMPQHNFKTINELPNENISMNPVLSAFADLGGLYQLNDKFDLYFGAYLDYGLSNAIDKQKNLLYQEDGKYNGFFASDRTGKVNPIAFGFKIGLVFNLNREIFLIKDMH